MTKATVQEACELLRKRIAAIKGDSRFSLQPANVCVNAPLALIQTDLNGQLVAYEDAFRIIREIK